MQRPRKLKRSEESIVLEALEPARRRRVSHLTSEYGRDPEIWETTESEYLFRWKVHGVNVEAII